MNEEGLDLNDNLVRRLILLIGEVLLNVRRSCGHCCGSVVSPIGQPWFEPSGEWEI